MRRSFSLIVIPIVLMAVLSTSALAQTRNLAVGEYRNKMKGGWLGQIIGVTWSAPTEFRFCDVIIPAEDMPEWKPETINEAFGQDDLYVEMTFLRSLETRGFSLTPREAGIDWANSKYGLAHANFFGRTNLRKGIAPPDSGHPSFNEHADDIDYQIEADYSGLIAPGMPNLVIKLGDVFGRMMNYGDGLYGGLFVGGMYAEAFFENDILKVIEAGLACIPADSQYAECMRDVIQWHAQNPTDWEAAWRLIKAKYQDNADYRRFSCNREGWAKNKEAFNIDAKINGAYIVMGLLYGDGDIEKSIVISTRCGQDSDCNPSNVAGVLGTIKGFDALPEQYKQIDQTTEFSYTGYTFPGLIQVCDSLARKAVVENGGAITKDDTGADVYAIPMRPAVPGALEQCWAPGPTAGSKFTPEEMDQICTGNAIDLGIYAGVWTESHCGADMAPGYYAEQLGRQGVLVTHPFDIGMPCSLKRTTAIPTGKKTRLLLEVGHHPEGEWDLAVNVNGEEVTRMTIGKEKAPEGFCSVEVDLTPYSGQTVDLELLNIATDWRFEAAYWDEIVIESK